MRKTLLLLAFPFLGFATDCILDYRILYGLAEMERHTARDVGYPFLISFNNKKNLAMLKNEGNRFFYKKLDNRTIDCLSLENCVKITKFLFSKGITNLDLGAFQINSRWHKYDTENYFKLGKSSKIVCKILQELENRNGWSWKTLANYHSSTEKLNRRYGERLREKIEGY